MEASHVLTRSPRGSRDRLPRSGRRFFASFLVVGLLTAFTAVSPASATLAGGSTFNALDGVLDANAGEAIPDEPSGSTDDSYTQGAKEQDQCPTVETGSIPNNKADLTEFYVATAKGTTDTFLYLAWERASTNGTVTLDFELNKSGEIVEASDCNGVNPTRTIGDKLITYDLQGNKGAETVVISVRTWGVGGWGDPVTLTAPAAEGSISSDLLFGEAAINLELSGIFTAGQCDNFATVLLKSRASSSFQAEMKDFIGPAFRHVANCGPLTVSKTVVGGAAGDSFGFTVDCPGTANDEAFSLVNGGSETFDDIPLGVSCSVTETVPGNSSYWATTYKVDAGSSASGRSVSVTINETGRSVAFTNTRVTGSLVIDKETVGGSGTSFTFDVDCSDDAFDRNNVTIVGSGSATISNIPIGTSCTVTEDDNPLFISTLVSADETVTIDVNGETVRFLNTRITGGLTISKTTTGGTGTFVFDVDCDGTAYDQEISITGSGAETISGIPTGTECTVTERDNPLFSSVVIPADGTVIMDDDGATVAFTNSRITGPLTISKTVIGPSSTFTFDVDCDGTAFDQVVTITGSGAKTITGIPSETQCTVTERANPAYSTVVSPAGGRVTVDAGGASVAFTNTALPVGIRIDKKVNGGDHATSADALLVHPLDSLDYSVVITNTGDVALTLTTMSDSLFAGFAAACPQSIGSVLAAGASITCSYQVSAASDANNVVQVTGSDSLKRSVSDDDGTYVDVISPAIDIVKTASTSVVNPGGLVVFNYAVTNIGDTTLNNVVVTDDVLGAVGLIPTLAPGASATLEKNMVAALDSPTRNVGTAAGTDILGKTVVDTDAEEISIVLGVQEERPAPLPELPRTGAFAGSLALLGIVLTVGGFALRSARSRRPPV